MDQYGGGPEPADRDLCDERVRRRMLAEGPVGEWETLPGTHTTLMDDVIRFAVDGTGESRSRSIVHGETVQRFTWSVARPGLLACIVVDPPPQPDAAGDPEPPETLFVGFRFEERHGDIGSSWVMCDPVREGFWNLVLPVVPRHSR
jgi:hypothetical protein